MTLAELKANAAVLGITIRANDWGEYRVAYRPPMGASRALLERIEDTASYVPIGNGRVAAAESREEALATAAAMWAWLDLKAAPDDALRVCLPVKH